MAISFVKQTETDVTTANTTSTTNLTSTTGNTLILIVVIVAGSTSKLSSVTDSANNTWVIPSADPNTNPPANFVSGSNTYFAMAYALNAAAVTSVTVNISASKAFSYNLVEFSGITTAAAVDQSQSVANSTAANPILTPSITTTNAADLIIGGAAATSSSITLASSGYTALSAMSPASMKGMAAYQVVSSTGSYQISWTAGSSVVSGAGIMAFKAASSGGGGGSLSGSGGTLYTLGVG